MTETILVTGSTGFIGARVLKRLEGEDVRVRVFLRPESTGGEPLESVEAVRGRFDDPEALRQAVAGVDRIVHLAGVTKAADEAAFDAGNVEPMRNLLAAVREHNPGLKRFVLVSSLAAAGPAREGTQGVRESDESRPVSAYGRSKLRAERLCMEVAESVPVTIVRPPAVYGPGDRDVLQVFQMLARGLLVSAGRSGRQRFSMIYVDDLVQGIMVAARSEHASGQTYYLTSAQSWSWDDVIAAARPALGFGRLRRISLPKPLVYLIGAAGGLVGALTGKPPLINRDKANELTQDYWVCSPDKAACELGFTAGTTLDEGIAKTVEWYREKGWL
ncbi:MAG: NAD-dependent epimerase/dehydratase family protein [Chlorobium sp.]|jgi:nucleoside-diphosphate-sugar epimerase|uniref:NAD-dependent epimerase/dehydratase family protein n=1 Tax=Chlorobium sp. TaxID=1095 RepID=UPI001E0F6F46|nr:NAD-dependent epimerase/dehydratase family protein [Chlorobium sp.]MBN1279282.1 NAD-dependent epimerase/dehydratase family protein [Chlorobiaceae bacterium]MCF8216782.1 NAD-dependent epimerase/dehydratase family protein [Chlorobium sp.]MCF8271650.1 NAD-dependent epimerase/dehydratase family protein [Chlorobium sp.]MCF8288022.1 NAD-dependent epimerase/dehydratase family protein [Chlorobium sp.]MCF8291585.1 NAD-dependent epimerase/dehydratase family protein [Chlorobium sp.]